MTFINVHTMRIKKTEKP